MAARSANAGMHRIQLRLPAGNPVYDGVIEMHRGIYSQTQQAEYLRLCVAVGHSLLTGGNPAVAETIRKCLNRGFKIADVPFACVEPVAGAPAPAGVAKAPSARAHPETSPAAVSSQASDPDFAAVSDTNPTRSRLVGNLTGKGQ